MRKLKEYIIDLKLPSEKLHELFKNYMESFEVFCEEYNSHYGNIKINNNLIEIHTGGWSDNEALISDLQRTAFWWKVHKIELEGGHYYLDLDRYNDDKKHYYISVK